MSDRGSSRSPGEIVYSYSQGTLVRSRDMESDSNRRRRQPREKEKKVIILRQNGRSVYRNSPEPEIIRERRVVRSVSNPTYVSGPTGYVVRRATKSSKSSYSSRTGTRSTTLTSTGSSGSYTDTSETCSTCSVTDSTSSYDRRPVLIRRRTVRQRLPSDEIEGYAARQFRSQNPGSWRIIRQREPESHHVVERERYGEPVYTEVRRVKETARKAPNQQASYKEDGGSASDSESEDTFTDATSQKPVIEKGFQDRMNEYRSQKYRNVATQMITHYVPQEEEPKEEIITHNVNTQTVEQETKRPPKLPKDRYKTAIIIPEPPPKAYHTDDEIEVVVEKDPGLTEEIVRKPEPPLILIQEIDLRPPPPEPAPVKDFGPKRKYIPPPPPPPPPDVVIRVGGGWMKEEHHRIQHRPLHRKFQPTSDRIPFVRSQFRHSRSKTPVVNKERKQTDRIRYASFIP